MLDRIAAAAAEFSGCVNILVFTGAGISTESGIPDFRGPNGLWSRVDPDEFTIDRYLTSRDTRVSSWKLRAESGWLDSEPNPAHVAVTSLWHTGRMVGCVTQNVDGLHARSGLPPEALVEMHGNATETVCVGCGHREPTTRVVRRLENGEDDPACVACGGILKMGVVMFGEYLPEDATQRATAMVDAADAILTVGSTLSVYPAATIPLQVVTRGHPMVIVNDGPTELDDLASVIIGDRAGLALPRLVALLTVSGRHPHDHIK
jgi:NAD-dependent deacetylase